jgi:signal transduction histidine kinase/ActR/RegA family two-component response regulator
LARQSASSEPIVRLGSAEAAAMRLDRSSKYRRIFDNLGESVLVFTVVRDGRGEIVDWVLLDANDEGLRVLGAPLEQVTGRRATDLFGEAAIAESVARSRDVMRNGRGEAFEIRFAWNGRHYLTSMFPLDHWHVATASVDITERVLAEEALRDADRRKTEFLAMLSHELRNPLAPIRNALFLLDRAAPGTAQAVSARAVLGRQTEHLARLVDDLLDVTRISRGKIELERERLDVADVVRRTAEDHRELLSSRGVALCVNLPDEPLPVEADRTRVAQIVGNLLTNASKFTPHGGTVTVSGARDGGSAVVAVRDDGAGIDPALLPHVFEPFVQADDGLHRTRGGLGLGLFLVRSLAELHGGSVVARSAGAGRGAEIVVRLPLARGEIEPLRPLRDVLAAAGRRRVLVIEDNPDAAEMMRELLEIAEHEVAVAADGRAGVDRALALRPDVVLCDIGLPEMDGYAVARALRAEASLASTLLVAVSGYALPEDLARASEAGFDRHLAKPVGLDQLGAVLATAARGA